MNGDFCIRFPLKEKYFVSLRLATAGVCDLAGLDVEETEDFKLCVAEACLALMRAGYCSAEVALREENGVSATVTGAEEGCVCGKRAADGAEFTLSLLRELVSEVTFGEKEGRIYRIHLKYAK